MKKLYNKISPLGAKISSIALLVSVLLLASAWALSATVANAWVVYYASLAEFYLIRLAIVAFVAVLLFKLSVLKEAIRKFVVMLKRNPSLIPLVMLFISFLYYSLNLTHVSDTTALIQGKGMGLCEFCIMLLNLLSLVCMLNAFPRRKKANIPMIVLMFVMFGILIYADIHYLNGIAAALNRAESPIKLDANTAYIAKAFNMLSTYQIMIYITAGLVVLLPVYSRLLKKIKTSIEVEDNGNMAEIEIGE
ncbi:MAG: hypothetical protein J6V34_04655 [Oscillospiraceae bacterium]|nr:hypothetical protein [Oscillospiraceae bacterium]